MRKKQMGERCGGTHVEAQDVDEPIELPDGIWDRINAKAHELWELRRRREGYDLQDCLDAEVIEARA